MGSVEEMSDRPTGEPAELKEQEQERSGKYFICSAQILHLTPSGRPLWFNGWMEKHKFLEHKDSDFETAPFDVFVKEPKVVHKGGWYSPWDMRNDNVMCLETEEPFVFDDRERKVLEMLQRLAKGGADEWM